MLNPWWNYYTSAGPTSAEHQWYENLEFKMCDHDFINKEVAYNLNIIQQTTLSNLNKMHALVFHSIA